MGWLRPSKEEAAAREASRVAQAAAERSRLLVERGGLPEAAAERMRHMAESGNVPFQSALTAADHTLVVQAGMQPLGHVMGTSVVKIAAQKLSWSLWGMRSSGMGGGYWSGPQFGHVDWMRDGWRMAYRRAFHRLEEEARLIGADLVLGVEIRRHARAFTEGAIEIWAGGTAVRLPGGSGSERPALTTLTAEDAVKLRQAGLRPAGAVYGVAAIVAAESPQQRSMHATFLGSGYRNQEMPDYTRLTYMARGEAMRDVSEQAVAIGASGIVGVQLSHHVEREVEETFELRMQTMHVLATAIAGTPHPSPPIPIVIDLTATKRKPRR